MTQARQLKAYYNGVFNVGFEAIARPTIFHNIYGVYWSLWRRLVTISGRQETARSIHQVTPFFR